MISRRSGNELHGRYECWRRLAAGRPDLGSSARMCLTTSVGRARILKGSCPTSSHEGPRRIDQQLAREVDIVVW